MKLLHSAAAAAVLLAAGAGPALAQSTPDWSGFYVGVHGGFLDSDDDRNETVVFDRDFDGQFDDMVVTTAPANAFSPGFCAGQANGTTPTERCDNDGGGVEGGARLGYDLQFGTWVIGAVADIQAVAVKDAVTAHSTTPAHYVLVRNLEHTAGLRARIGYGFGPALVYATGGLAYGKVDNRF